MNVTNLSESRQAAVKLYRFTSTGREEVSVGFDDLDADGYADRVSWAIPRLENDSYELAMGAIDAVTYARDSEAWTLRFNVTEEGELRISPVNGTFAELQEDDASTNDTLGFLSLGCLDIAANATLDLTPALKVTDAMNATLAYADLANVSMGAAALTLENYTCRETGVIVIRPLQAGGGIELRLGGDVARVHDPIQPALAANGTVDVVESCQVMEERQLTLATDLSCLGHGIVINAPDAELNCLGRTVRGQGQGAGILVNASRARLLDCMVEGFDTGILLLGNGTMDDTLFLDGFTLRQNRVGMRVDKGWNVYLANGFVKDNSEIGLEVANSTNATLQSIVARNNPYGFRIVDTRPVDLNISAFNSTQYGAEYIDGGFAQRMLTIS
jgi:hypothetical protein